MIEVFHGSYTEVDRPVLSFSRKTLDFGTGFYVTPVQGTGGQLGETLAASQSFGFHQPLCLP